MTARTLISPKRLSIAFASGLAFLVLFAGQGMARPEMAGQSSAARFAAMDTDKSGTVTREEFFAAQPNMKEGAFLAIDTDNDGQITLKEWEAFSSTHGKSDPHAGGAMGSDAATAAPADGKSTANQAPQLIMPPKKAD